MFHLRKKKIDGFFEATKSKKAFVCELSCNWLKSAIFYLLFPSQSVDKLFPIISSDYLSQPTPSLSQREPAFSHRNHAQYCPSTTDRVVICIFKQEYTLGKISCLFKKDIEKSGILYISSANPLSFYIATQFLSFLKLLYFKLKNYSFPRWNLIWFNPINTYTVFYGKGLLFLDSKHVLA